MVFKVTKNRVIFDQFHQSVAKARSTVSKSISKLHGTLSKDFPDFKLGSVKLAPGVNPKKHGRRLYRITLVKRKKRKAGRVFISSKKKKRKK